NVRLGWWLGNPGEPGKRTVRNASPRLSVWPLAFEALGRTNDKRSYIYLSDGGHFENLGLYEMVRRRCQVIVVCDAGQDPRCALDDLGRAIRQIRTDLGVPITFCASDVAGAKSADAHSAKCDAAPKSLDHIPGEVAFSVKPRRWNPGEAIDAKGRYCAIAEIDYPAVDG